MRLVDVDLIEKVFDPNTWQGEMMITIVRGLPTVNEWIPCSERLPTKEECEKQSTNLFEVTKIVSNKFRITDYCLIHTDYKTWHIRDNEEVIAWRYKVEPYIE